MTAAGHKQIELKAIADAAIQPLQDKFDVDDIEPEEKALLIAWKKFRIALTKVETQPGYPLNVDWPVQPV